MDVKGFILSMLAGCLFQAAFAPPALALTSGLPPPTLIKSACRGEDIESMIGYYVEKTVGAQLEATVQAGLSDFGSVKEKSGEDTCTARINVEIPGEVGDVAWAHYQVSRRPELTIRVSFSSVRALSGYTLPTDKAPAIVHASLLAEMPPSRRKADLPAVPPGMSLPIAYLEILGEARKRLLAAGWIPKQTLHPGGDVGTAERAYMAAGYSEVDGCAVDVDVCSLDYVDAKGDCLYVTSESEKPEDAFVGGWSFGCQGD